MNKPDSRRKLLKSLAAGSGAVVAGKSLPESWTKPVINSVVLPAHANTTDDSASSGDSAPTPNCCDGVFCRLEFDKEVRAKGSIEVSDCMIRMIGFAGRGTFSGNGSVAADGSFSFNVSVSTYVPDITTAAPTTIPPYNLQVTGKVSSDCSTISGTLEEYGAFTGTVTPGMTNIEQCFDG